MNQVELLIINPLEGNEHLKNRTVIGITKVGKDLGYIIESPFNKQKLLFIGRSEYVEVNPQPEDEIEVLRKKVYEYELMVARLLTYPDLIVLAAVRNELPRTRGLQITKSRE